MGGRGISYIHLTGFLPHFTAKSMEHDQFCPPEPERVIATRPPPAFGVLNELPAITRRRNNDKLRAVATGPEFIGECHKHGQTLLDTETAACLSCLAEVMHGLPVRIAYRAAGGFRYPSHCPEHGEALHSVKTGRCTRCGVVGAPPSSSPRAAARREGALSYVAYCGEHGNHAHSVGTGKCLGCYTTQGKIRQSEVAGEEPRAAARRTGSRTYMADCPEHGSHEHCTTRGKCLGCFNTLGQPRRAPNRGAGNPLRIAARRAGDNTYLSHCETHGEYAHNTARGQCLGCFTTTGQPRKFFITRVGP